MKTSKIKTVRNIGRIRTLLITFSVAVCLATLMGCGNKPEKDASPAADDIETLRKAAEQGNADAQYDFGVLYADGEGVPSDSAEAAKWYRKAAEQGHAWAQYRLGVMYRYGRGVPQDYVAAYAWYIVAAASGDDDLRKKRDIIKRELMPSQVAKGEAIAREISERIEKEKAARRQ